MSTRTGAGRRWIQCLATEVEALLFSVRGPTFFKGVYRLGGRDTEPDERQDHGPDSYMRLGAFADMSAPRASTRRVSLPEGHDPNSFFVQGGDAHQFQALLEAARP